MSHSAHPQRPSRLRLHARSARVLPWACALQCLLATLPAAALAPTFEIAPSTLELEPGAKAGKVNFVLTATPAVADSDVPKIEDAGVPAARPVEVQFEADKPKKGPKSTQWLVRATASNVPLLTSQRRLAHVTLGQDEAFVPYTLTNLNPAFRWTVQQPPATWSLGTGRDIPFAVTVGAVKATGVHVVSCSLVEKTTGSRLMCDHLLLCKASCPVDCSTNLELAAQRSHPLFLRIADGFQEPGSYSGTVTVGANEVVDAALPAAMQMTVSSTTPGRQAWGFLVILIGVCAAFWVTVYRRNGMLHDQALIPAAILIQTLQDLKASIGKSLIDPNLWKPTKTAARIEELLASLTEASLAGRNYIPGSFPNPAATVDASGYQTFLQGVSDSIAALTAIVQEGFQVAWAHWDPASPQQQILDVLHDIDGLAAIPGLALAEVRSRIQAYLGRLQNQVKFQALLAAQLQAPKPPPSLAVVNLDIKRLNLYGWTAWVLLTLVAATAALILTNPAFGTFSDYVQCFLWSFGIAAAGQLTTLSLGSVSNALGISLLKP